MGMANPRGLWVGYNVGLGMGWTLDTHTQTQTHGVGMVGISWVPEGS